MGGMSDKKVHEVELMSYLIHSIAEERGITSVIDLGSGQGYLSRALAFDYGMEVLAVDMSEIQTQGAVRFDKKALKSQGLDQNTELSNLKHVTEKITPENIADVLHRWSPESEDKQWLVTGLHTCGDLSPMIFNLFAKSDQVSCVVNVGCCYNALSATGFPMSQYLQEKKQDTMIRLGSTARVLSCHTPSRWSDDAEDSIKAFDNYYFRALLQVKKNKRTPFKGTLCLYIHHIRNYWFLGVYRILMIHLALDESSKIKSLSHLLQLH